MDKYEYRIRAEEINALIERKEYVEAVKIADTIDWRRVRSVVMLCKVSELYKMNRRYEDSKEVLLLAYDLQPNSRKIVYSLCELSIKLEETVQAVEYYKEFTHIAPRDTGRYILQYRLYEAQDVSLEERIAVLEEYKKRDYREKWAYELAYLYHRIGLATRCVEECDELVLWFGEGRYVIKALELKMLHAPLTPEQQEKYNARFAPAEEVAENTQEEVKEEPSLPIEIKAVDPTRAKTEEIPARQVKEEVMEQEAIPEPTREMPEIPYDVMTGYVQQPVFEESVPEESALEEIVSAEPALEEALPEEMVSEEAVSEETLEESALEEPAEDEDMKIVNPAEDLDIQVKTIDVGDAYNTINLQEELAKNLAEILAQEDMEAADATKTLPVDSIFQAATIAASLENAKEVLPGSTAAVEEVTEISAPEEEESVEEAFVPEQTEEAGEETVIGEPVAVVEEVKPEEPVRMDTSDIVAAALKIKSEIMAASLDENKEEERAEEPEAVVEEEKAEESEAVAEEEVRAVEPIEELETEELEEIEEPEAVEEPVTEPITEPVTELITEPVTEPIIESVTEPTIEPEPVIAEEEVKTEKPASIEPLFFGKNEPLPEAFIQAVQSVAMEAAKEAAKQAAHATVEAMKEIQPEIPVSDKEESLSEANKEEKLEEVADWQEKEPEPQVEKQITGQLSFTDIMAEWEETKKANEEKHLQEIKQRVLEQTGPLFSDFDTATGANSETSLDMLSPMLDVFSSTDGLATEVENALAEESITPAAEETPATYEAPAEEPVIPVVEEASLTYEEPVAQPVVPAEEKASAIYEAPVAEPIVPAVEETPATYNTLSEKLVPPPVETPEPAVQTEKANTDILEDRPSSFNTEEINGLEDKLMYALGNQHYETANIPVPIPVVKEEIGPRVLTKEEKEYFGSIAQTKDLQEKVAYALDSISLVPTTGNVIVTGEKGTGALEIAQNVAAYLSKTRSDFTGNSITYTGKELMETNVVSIVNEVVNGALIVDNAGDLSANLCGKLIKAANELIGRGIVLIFVDTKSDIDRLTRAYQKITEHFDVRIDITTLDNNGLVNFGKEYAKEKEYSIDDMGVLALYNRIEERQTNEHAVTIEEVKEIVNEAIIRAEKKNLTHFMDVIFAKRYDKDDMVVLREKDFINE